MGSNDSGTDCRVFEVPPRAPVSRHRLLSSRDRLLFFSEDPGLTDISTQVFPSTSTNSLEFSSSGGLLAAGGFGGEVSIWSTSSGSRVADYRNPRTPEWDEIAENQIVDHLAFSRDETLLAAESGFNVFVWDVPGSQREEA
jgi:WD40 repeat protein